MRVTNYISNQQFLTNNNMMLTRQIKSNNRIATQRRFDRVSEDIVNGSKAMTIRRELRDIDIYNKNLNTAKTMFYSAETNLTFIAHDNYIAVEERLVAATNGTHDQMELDIYATELDEIADQMVKTLNQDFSERQLFGGESNGPVPFQIQRCVITEADTGNVVYPPDYNKYYNADGTVKEDVELDDIPRQVTYNGVPLDFDVTSDLILPDGTLQTPTAQEYKIQYLTEDKDKNTGKLEYKLVDGDPSDGNVGVIKAEDVQEAIVNNDNSLIYPGSKPIYVDIGLGARYDENYDIDPQTALDVSLNGAEITGCGIDVDKVETEEVVIKSVTGMILTSTAGMLSNGFVENTTVSTGMRFTINGIDLVVDIDDKILPMKDGGDTYTNEEVSSILTKALADAYKDAAGEELNGKVTIDVDCIKAGATVTWEETDDVVIANNYNFLLLLGDKTPTETTVTRAKTDEDGIPDLSEYYSKNLMQLVIDSADALRRGDQDYVNAVIDRANTANNHILKEITTLGTKQNSIDFYQLKNNDYEINLKDRQNITEGTDMENEIIEYEGVKAAYEAVLKMSSAILGSSIFDFI